MAAPAQPTEFTRWLPKEAATIVVILMLIGALIGSYGFAYWLSVQQAITSDIDSQAIPSYRLGGKPVEICSGLPIKSIAACGRTYGMNRPMPRGCARHSAGSSKSTG